MVYSSFSDPSYSDDDYGNGIKEPEEMTIEERMEFDRTVWGNGDLYTVVATESTDASTSTASRSTVSSTTTTEEPEIEKEMPSPPPLYVPSLHKVRRQRLPQSNVKLKTCTKKVSLYTLQPAKLNNTGLSNPLKGKLTNCHATGCER